MDLFSLTDTIDVEVLRKMLVLVLLSIARFSAFFVVFPVFGRVVPPGLLRTGIIFGIALVIFPHLAQQYDLQTNLDVYDIVLILLKEAFLGMSLGLAFGFLAWGVEGAGNLIDFNRGAFLAAMFSPLTQVSTTPLGSFFIMLYSVFLFTSGAFLLILGLVYDSFLMWPVFSFFPTINHELPILMLGGMDKMMTVMLLISGPIIILNFITELALSIYTRYAQQLNVFIFALPIKSGIAFLMLVLTLPFIFRLFEHDLFFIERMYARLIGTLGG
ncbi:EscT/YscT/HrcT family type III secretion system export apparatus protein [Chromatiales bacterium (ex Bugula neritina AB1)]|nr:EscT/YscT/HrcT family type III secretion system export apparatus protein [Chromatiales bacterium (ex Bugula neritina AB1)]